MLGLWPGSITMTGPFADGRRVGDEVVRVGFGFGAARVGVRFFDGRCVAGAAVVVGGCVDGVVELAVLVCGVAGCPDDVDVQAAVNATEQIAATAKALVRADPIMNPRGTCIAKSCQPGTSALVRTPARQPAANTVVRRRIGCRQVENSAQAPAVSAGASSTRAAAR